MIAKTIVTFFMLSVIASASDISNDKNLLDQKNKCLSQNGYIWNNSLNSCQIDNRIESIDSKASGCESSDCYIDTASNTTNVSKNDSLKSSKLETTGKVAAAAYIVFSKLAIRSIGKSGGELAPQQDDSNGKATAPGATCASKTVFKLTSAAWIAGDFFLKHSLKKKLKKLEKSYKSEIANDRKKGGENGSYQAQVRAFHYLLEEQKLLYNQAKNRSLLQLSVGAGYTLATAIGLYEMTPTGSVGACYINKGNTPDQLPPPPKNGQKIKGEFLKKFTKFGSSAQIALVSGLMGGLNIAVMKSAYDEKARVLENIKTINEAISAYEQYKSGFCPDGRDDLVKPQCYCYQNGGKPNPLRTKSAICQRLFAYDSINYSDQIKNHAKNSENIVCVTVNGKIDKACRCKNMVNTSTGMNACANISTKSLLSGGFPSGSAISSIIGPLNKLTTGSSTALGSLDSSSLKNAASRVKGLVLKMKSHKKLNNYPSNDYFNHYANRVASSIPALSTQNPKLSPLMSDSGPMSGLTKDNIQKALNELRDSDSQITKKGIEFKSEGKGALLANKLKNALSWNDSRLKDQEMVFDMVKNGNEKDFGDNDIAKDNNHTIFEILSRRYQITGVKRLFE